MSLFIFFILLARISNTVAAEHSAGKKQAIATQNKTKNLFSMLIFLLKIKV
jgi:hypothetical protein